MPPVIAWVAAAVTAVTAGVVAGATATWVATLLVNGAIMFAAQKLMGKKANFGDFMSEVVERQTMVRQSTAPRRLIYGRCKVSGNMVYAKETGTKREYLHMAIVLASHQCDSIQDYYVNEELVPFDGDEPIVGNKYYGFLRITKHLGTAAQVADANLVAECAPEWTTDHRLRGHAYLAVRLKFDDTVFPSGLPTISAIPRGRLILDPRDGITRWTNNVALCVYDFMQSAYGLSIPVAEFDAASVIAAANVCDEDVGLSTTFTRQADVTIAVRHIPMTTQDFAQLDGVQPGMHIAGAGIPAGAVVVSINLNPDDTYVFFTIDVDPTASTANTTLTFGDSEKRYTCNGTVDTATRAADVIDAMLSAMAGKAVYAGGKWFLHAGAYQTPTVTLTEDDCRGPIQVTTKLSRRELANTGKAIFVSEAEGWVATDRGIPAYAPALYLAEDDGEELPRTVNLPFTTSSSTGQRLIKIEIERIRQQILTRWPCKLSALKVQCGDNVMLSNEREGWVSKVFEVVSFILVPYKDARGNPAIGVDLVLRETSSGVWDWADGAETVVDLAPNTNLQNPFVVTNPTLLTVLADGTTSWTDNDGAHVPRVRVGWTAPNDQYVLSGGIIQIQYKKHADADWIDWNPVPGSQTFDFISDVKASTAYDFRVRSVSVHGVPASTWLDSLTAYPAGYTVSGDVTATDPVTSLTATALPEAIKLDWVLPDITIDPNKDLDFCEVYESATALPAPGALTAATFRVGKATSYTRSNISAGSTGYYWVRTVDESRNRSTWTGPQSATAATGVTGALAAAAAAQATANGKNKVFYQTTAPSSGMVANDIWYDTDDSYKQYVYSGGSWTASFQPLITLDGSNNVTGLVLASGTTRDWVMVATKFQIWDGVSATAPFEVVAGVTRIKEAMIQTLDAGKITAGTVSVAVTLTAANIVNGTITSTSGNIAGFDLASNKLSRTSGSGAQQMEIGFNGSAHLSLGLGATAGSVTSTTDLTFRDSASNLLAYLGNTGSEGTVQILNTSGLQWAISGGVMYWGSAADTNLYRPSSNNLKTDDAFTAVGLVTGGSFASTHFNADVATAVDVMNCNLRVFSDLAKTTQVFRVDGANGEVYIQGTRVLTTRQATPITLADVIAVLQAHGLSS